MVDNDDDDEIPTLDSVLGSSLPTNIYKIGVCPQKNLLRIFLPKIYLNMPKC